LTAQGIFWVLVISGAATCSMLVQALAPRVALRFIFGEDITNPGALLVARSWGAMIFVSGLLLIASAWHSEWRVPVVIATIAGKSGFALLVLANGSRYLARPAFGMAIADLAIVALLAWFLLA
jgi:hypothetical protein